MLPNDLKSRGVTDDPALLEVYPYARVGMTVWNLLKAFSVKALTKFYGECVTRLPPCASGGWLTCRVGGLQRCGGRCARQSRPIRSGVGLEDRVSGREAERRQTQWLP